MGFVGKICFWENFGLFVVKHMLEKDIGGQNQEECLFRVSNIVLALPRRSLHMQLGEQRRVGACDSGGCKRRLVVFKGVF